MQQLQPLVWFRYIDDIFFIWMHNEEKFKIFLNSLDEFDPCIKLTYESNKESIAFLDIKVNLRNSKVFTDLYFKPTERFKARLCELIGYVVQRRILKIIKKKWNCGSGKESLIRSEMNKVKFSNLRLKSNDKNHKMKGIPLVVRYHPLLKFLSGIIDKNLSTLYMDKEVKKVFTLQSMVSFHSARKLSSYLVRAKLYPSERTVSSCKCKSKQCQKFAITSQKQIHLLFVMIN